MESPEAINKPSIEYPEGLTDRDIELVNKQCENQNATTKWQIEGFANAYKKAKDIALSGIIESYGPEQVQDMILDLAVTTEPYDNDRGYRRMDVLFKSGSRALPVEQVPRAMDNFCLGYSTNAMDSVEFYKEFQAIHPFKDGNGRVGDLLWKIDMNRKTGAWPEALPPDVFGVHS